VKVRKAITRERLEEVRRRVSEAAEGRYHATVFNKHGEHVGSISQRSYGTYFFCLWHARGRALELDGIGGRPRDIAAILEAEGFEVRGPPD
jgi:hypothetical protein